MIDSIQVALTGMVAYQRGLNVISNNVSNMNTVGFRGSSVSFSDLYWQGPALPGDRNGASRLGSGVDGSRTFLDLNAGDAQTTGRALDASLDGSGWFVVKDAAGATRYTRAGSFDIDDSNRLVVRGKNIQVMGFDASGELMPVSLSRLQLNAATPTATIKFNGDLSGNDATFTVNDATVVDKLGGAHKLKLVFTKNTTGGNGTNISTWDLAVFEGSSQVGNGSVQFIGTMAGPPVLVNLALSNSQSTPVSFDFSGASGATLDPPPSSSDPNPAPTSTLAVESQDGVATGSLASVTFDPKGVLQLTYSNGQTIAGPKLALARIPDEGGLVELGDSLFDYRGSAPVQLRAAGDDLRVKTQSLEASNVDLTTQFSTLILMQRGYQAASEVVSTANTLIQQLIDMRSGR